jgi:autotransporter family porin
MQVGKQMEFKKTRVAHAVALSFTLAASMPALAVIQDPCPGLSTVTVNTAETLTGRVLTACQNIEVTSAGSIIPGAMPASADGVKTNNAQGTFISNAGTIITTMGAGISVGASAVVSSITNSGTVQGGSYPALNLTNSGNVFVVSNTGTISGTINMGINTLNVNGSTSVIDGNIYGTGIVNVNGTWVRGGKGSINATTLNIIPDAKLQMNLGGAIYGDVNNSGALVTAAGRISSISGTYTQSVSGVFRTVVAASDQYGKLLFIGAPDVARTLPSGFKIDVDVATGLTLAQDTVLADVIKSYGNIESSTFSVTDNSSLFNFVAVKNGTTSINLKVTTQGATSAVDSVKAANDTASADAAKVIDVLSNNPGAMQDFITALGNLNNSAEVAKLIKKTLPLMITSVKQSSFAQQRSGDRVIQALLEKYSGLSSGDEMSDDRRAWAKPFGSWADQSDLKGVTGYKSASGGIVVGADSMVSATTRVGGALSYSTSKIDNNTATNHADVTALRLIGYGTYSLDSNTDLNFQADIGTSNTKGSRAVNAAGVTNIYSDYNTLTGGLSVGVGRNVAWSPKTTFVPSMRLSYAMMEDAGYTETNAEAFKGLNLMVAKSTGDELVALLEGKVTHELSESSKLVFNLGAGYDFLAKKSSLAASYTGGGGQFVTNGMDIAPWSYRAGVGYVSQGKKLEFTTRYEVEAREGSTNQVASLKLRMPF